MFSQSKISNDFSLPPDRYTNLEMLALISHWRGQRSWC